MRKYNYSLIKKTEQRYGIARGTDTVYLPLGRCDGAVELAELHGRSEYVEDRYRFVGDERSSGGYSIPITLKSRNLMDGNTYAAFHKAGATGFASNDGTFYYWLASVQDVGKTIISRDEIAFKENTVYTLAVRMKYTFASPGYSHFLAKVVYTDGTEEPIQFYKVPNTDPYVTFSTKRGKTVEGITHFNGSNAPTKFYLDTFGIFEGEYSDYFEVFEPYGDISKEIEIERPLASVGAVHDILDLKRGILTRKICPLAIGADAEVYGTEKEGVFRVMLSERIRQGSRILGELRTCSYLEFDEKNSGICIAEDGNSLFIKFDGITTMYDFMGRISDYALRIVYILADYREEEVTIPIPEDSASTIVFSSTVAPKRVIMIYETERT